MPIWAIILAFVVAPALSFKVLQGISVFLFLLFSITLAFLQISGIISLTPFMLVLSPFIGLFLIGILFGMKGTK